MWGETTEVKQWICGRRFFSAAGYPWVWRYQAKTWRSYRPIGFIWDFALQITREIEKTAQLFTETKMLVTTGLFRPESNESWFVILFCCKLWSPAICTGLPSGTPTWLWWKSRIYHYLSMHGVPLQNGWSSEVPSFSVELKVIQTSHFTSWWNPHFCSFVAWNSPTPANLALVWTTSAWWFFRKIVDSSPMKQQTCGDYFGIIFRLYGD